MSEKRLHGALRIEQDLYDFVVNEALPLTDISPSQFWDGFEATLRELSPINESLLKKRDHLQTQLDEWYLAHRGKNLSHEEHERFLRSIGYLVEKPAPIEIETTKLDPEIALISAPQLVVPSDNARYVLNAANARWGSLLDVLYGTDMIDEEAYPKMGAYNPKRGEKVFEKVFAFLDEMVPLEEGSYASVLGFERQGKSLIVHLPFEKTTVLKVPQQWVGYCAEDNTLSKILFVHHGLHIELILDANGFIGKTNPSGIQDVILESALSAIVDCEDSVAAVDSEDKIKIYRHWNGLMKGDLATEFENKGKCIHRSLNSDKTYLTPAHETLTLKGRVLLLIRNVGIHMYTDAITYNNHPIPEGFLDAFVSSVCAIHDLKKHEGVRNSVQGSVYIVKPKCHGPEEIAFVNQLFGKVEEVLGLEAYTLKIGIMDEERRTSANLQASILAAKKRVFFINTGFLDRTGDEIHSIMELGAIVPKESIKQAKWLKAYEDQNVDIGLALGFKQKAQIGKGMWTMPDAMRKMVEVKIIHPRSGATTAWVPSPTAATLHALHYHYVDVQSIQAALVGKERASLEALLTPPLLEETLSETQKLTEIENNIQSILGYVVRWVDQGIGCSKVPDINNIELMEDRATLRISSQHLANWLYHNIITREQVECAFEKMAKIVDEQNKNDKNYTPMATDFANSIAYAAARDLVFEGRNQPNGYTEFILHVKRKAVKNRG